MRLISDKFYSVWIFGSFWCREFLHKSIFPIAECVLEISLSKCAFPLQVPKGSVWVEGDYKFNSRDSRKFGPVPYDLIRGRLFWRVSLLYDTVSPLPFSSFFFLLTLSLNLLMFGM